MSKLKHISDFDLRKRKLMGGVTGSFCVPENSEGNPLYQVKPSILDNKLLRRAKALDTDRENFGEFIAGQIGLAAFGPDVVPEIFLVYDEKLQKIYIASKYLVGDEVKTLNQYVMDHIEHFPKEKHACFVAGNVLSDKENVVSLDSDIMSPLKPSLAQAIVFSAVVGDHDVNPGNMLVIKRGEKSYIARIDFGHALLDLLNAPITNGGQLKDEQNPILDFFNREKVAGLQPGGAPSKLQRDYPGIIPSQEIIDELKTQYHIFSQTIDAGLANARAGFVELITEMANHNDMEGIAHVKQSLSAIYKNITGKKFKSETPIETVVDETFSAISLFLIKNTQNLVHVANAMQVQLDVDKSLNEGLALEQRDVDILKEANFPRDRETGKFKWLKLGQDEALSGDFQKYLVARVDQLVKQNPDQKRVIYANYTKISDEYRKMRIFSSLGESSAAASGVTAEYKAAAQQVKIDKEFTQSDTESLSDSLEDFIDGEKFEEIESPVIKTGDLEQHLQHYIKIRLQETKGIGGISKEEKIAAAQALIDALHGVDNPSFPGQYTKALKDGNLCTIISRFVNDNIPSLKPRSDQEKVDTLLSAIQNNMIPVLSPRSDFTAKQ